MLFQQDFFLICSTYNAFGKYFGQNINLQKIKKYIKYRNYFLKKVFNCSMRLNF